MGPETGGGDAWRRAAELAAARRIRSRPGRSAAHEGLPSFYETDPPAEHREQLPEVSPDGPVPGRTERRGKSQTKRQFYPSPPGGLSGSETLEPESPQGADEDRTEAPVGEGEPGGEEVADQSGDLQTELDPEDQSALSEAEHRSVIDSVKGFIEFAKERLISLAADHILPVVGGRIVDWFFELRAVVTSVRALGSDHPVLEVPLPVPVPDLGFTLEIPLGGGDSQTAPPVAFCVAPDSPSLTGGWALDADEDDDEQAQPPPADNREAALERLYGRQEPALRQGSTTETSRAGRPKPRVRRRPATACLVETDLGPLQLPRSREVRARVLAILATEYASRFPTNPYLGRFEVLIIADKGWRHGLWIWLDADAEIDRLVLQAQLG